MEPRLLSENEIPQAMALVRHVFDVCLRRTVLQPQMVEAFENYVTGEHIAGLVREGKLALWGYFSRGYLCGVAGMQREGHITLLYVLPNCQKRGVGKTLLGTMRKYAAAVWQLKKVTVNAMPTWTTGYFQRNGFQMFGAAGAEGMPFVPLEAKTITEVRYPVKKIKNGTLLGIVWGFLGFILVSAIVFMSYLTIK